MMLTMNSLWLFAFSLPGVASILQTMQLDVYLGGVAGEETKTRAAPTYTMLASEAFFGPHPEMTNARNAIHNLALPPKQNPLLCKASQTAESLTYESSTLILVPRGGCSFETKALNAQQLGAKAAAVFGTLSSRYSINTTSRSVDHEYEKSDIVFPMEFQDYDCSKGRAEIPEGAMSFTPRPYNGNKNDPLLMGNTSSNLCLSRSTDSLLHCTSLACLLTGRRIVANNTVVPESMLEACCAWDFHIWLSGNGNSSRDPGSNQSVQIPAVYLTMSQGNRLLQDLTRYSIIHVVLSTRWRPAYDLSSVLIWALGVTVATAAAYVSAHGYRYTNLQARTRQQQAYNSRRQEQPRPSLTPEPAEDSLELTAGHAIGFIFVASSALLVLYWAKIYSFVKVLYAIGCSTAISQVLLDPLLRRAMQLAGVRNRVVVRSMLDFENVSIRDFLAHSVGFAIGIAWLFISFKPHPDEVPFYWITQDVFGAAMCMTFLQTIRVNSLKVATILLSAAFFYDVFFVFVSPILFKSNVMIEVATSGGPPKADPSWCEKYPDDKDCSGGDPLPMLFTIPRIFDYQGGSSLLGLGDIVIPGLLLSFAARYDAATFMIRSAGRVHDRTPGVACSEARHSCCRGACFRGYFVASVCAYAAGLCMANFGVYLMKMGQPALFYIVPCCLGTVLYQSWRRQELHDLWNGPAAIHKADLMLSGLGRASADDAAADSCYLRPSSDNEEDEFDSIASGDRALLL